MTHSLDPLSAVIQAAIGSQLFLAGQFDEALAEADKALKLSPDFPIAHDTRGDVFLLQKKIAWAFLDSSLS